MNHPFKVGEIYKNRIGAYEVIRIDEKHNVMLIRYFDSGEEFETKIDVQARILRNIHWDEQMAREEKEAAEARYQQGYGDEFTGLLPTDFKTNVEGTSWRSRRNLAGRVAKILSDASANPTYTLLSWAIYRWPVAFLSHREFYQMAASEMGARKAKFTIELDEHNLYYGFYIERYSDSGAMDHTWDWPRFWLSLQKRPALPELINMLETNHQVRFIGRAIKDADPFHFANLPAKGAHSLWDEQNPSHYTVAERLDRLKQVPEGEWIDFYLIATMPKEDALQAGVKLAGKMVETMKEMLPFYTAAVRG
jgi:hypothetical protein